MAAMPAKTTRTIAPGVEVLCWLSDYWDETTHLALLASSHGVHGMVMHEFPAGHG